MSDYKYYLDEGIVDFRNGKYSNALENINASIELKDMLCKEWETFPEIYPKQEKPYIWGNRAS